MADITFNCPECGGSLSVDREGAGRMVACPVCAKQIQIPDPGTRQLTSIPPPALASLPLARPASPNASIASAPPLKRGISYGQGWILIILLLVALGFPLLSMFKPVERWEYRIEAPSDMELASTINTLGEEGWELVFARRATSGSEYATTAKYEMIFKRPKR
ncbi:MAG: DUF4177 domain-containing protein [Verrucomicrobiia bacterium]